MVLSVLLLVCTMQWSLDTCNMCAALLLILSLALLRGRTKLLVRPHASFVFFVAIIDLGPKFYRKVVSCDVVEEDDDCDRGIGGVFFLPAAYRFDLISPLRPHRETVVGTNNLELS